jgi:hypothetical protein
MGGASSVEGDQQVTTIPGGNLRDGLVEVSFLGSTVNVGTWMGSPRWQICDGLRSRGRASHQANWWVRPAPETATDKSSKRNAQACQIMS